MMRFVSFEMHNIVLLDLLLTSGKWNAWKSNHSLITRYKNGMMLV